MDVTNSTTIISAIQKAIEFSNIDILVNNAGVPGAPGSTGTRWRDEDWDFTWKVNVKGLHEVTEAVLPSTRHQDFVYRVLARMFFFVNAYFHYKFY